MLKNIFVGNLPFSATTDDVRALFEQYGEVQSAKVITDRETGRSRGFGFVEMPTEEADAAISALAGYEMDGRPLRVNEAMERRERKPQQRRSW
ncbi:RNA-binding protein [Desulfocarbo indianensis]|nr:RNA-binding protein [Desulfocarbo indianensis]